MPRLPHAAAAVAPALTACLAALAAGASSAASAFPASPAMAPAAPAGATATTAVLLLNGDQAVVTTTAGGASLAAIRQGPGSGLARSLLALRLGGRGFLIPMAALPYLGRGLDPSLFGVSALRQAETGSLAGRLPVTLRYQGALPHVPGVTVTHSARGVAEGYLTASSARLFGAALARQMRADHARGSYGADGMFAGGLSISLPGAAAPPARRAFPMHVLTMTGTNLAGGPDTGDVVDVFNLNDLAAFGGGFDSENIFYHGTAKYSVPAGTYWAVGTFFTGNGFRIDVLPQFTVSGDTTAAVSEQAASSKITISTPRPAAGRSVSFTLVRGTPRALVSFGWESDGPGASLWVSPAARKPTAGTLHAFTSAQLGSAHARGTRYDYTLDFPAPAGIIPPQRFTVRPAGLATVAERYYQDLASTGGWITLGGTAYQLRTSFVGGLIPSLRLPARQTQYISARPAMLWQSEYWAYYGNLGGGQTESIRLLHGGQQVADNWGRYPLHPGTSSVYAHTSLFPALPSAVRAGNTLYLDITPFSDNHRAHLGSGFSGPIFGRAAHIRGSYALYQNGRKIAGGNALKVTRGAPDLFLRARLGSGPARIRFVLAAGRASKQYSLSAASRDVWSWRTARDPAATVPPPWYCGFTVVHGRGRFDRHCAVQRMMTLRYNVAGLSPAGTARPGHQVLHVTVGHLQQAAASRVTHAWAMVSFDGGKSWHPARVARTGAERLRVTFAAPRSSRVSLRVSVHGRGGSSLTETVTGAYATAPR